MSGYNQRERIGRSDKFGEALSEPPCLLVFDSLPPLPKTRARLEISEMNELARHCERK